MSGWMEERSKCMKAGEVLVCRLEVFICGGGWVIKGGWRNENGWKEEWKINERRSE